MGKKREEKRGREAGRGERERGVEGKEVEVREGGKETKEGKEEGGRVGTGKEVKEGENGGR